MVYALVVDDAKCVIEDGCFDDVLKYYSQWDDVPYVKRVYASSDLDRSKLEDFESCVLLSDLLDPLTGKVVPKGTILGLSNIVVISDLSRPLTNRFNSSGIKGDLKLKLPNSSDFIFVSCSTFATKCLLHSTYFGKPNTFI